MSKAGRTVAIGILLVLTSACATDASAAVYEVHACRLPSGASAPAHGWTITSGSGPGAVSAINCPGGAMTSRPADGQHIKGTLLGFSFTAPPGTTIASYDRQAEGAINQVDGGPPPWDWAYGEFGTRVGSDERAAIGLCTNCGPFSAAWIVPVLSPRLSRIFSGLECESQNGPGPCQANGSYFVLRWITLRLEDLKAPEVSAASGSLLENAAPQRGARYLSLKLRDIGGGLLKARVEVDGQRFSEQPIDDNDGRCKQPFVAPVPCKLSASVELPIDTGKLPDGHHQLTVRVFDATGVNSALYGPIPIDVDNVTDPAPSRLTCPARAHGRLTRHLGAKVTRF